MSTLMTKQAETDGRREGGGEGWRGRVEGREGYALAAGSSASNDGLKGSTRSILAPIKSRQSRGDVRQSPALWESSSR